MLFPRKYCLRACIAAALLAVGAWPGESKSAVAAEAGASADAAKAAGVEYFESQIRPLLVQHCLQCHGDKEKGGLRLDSRSAMMAGGPSGQIVAPGNPDGSLLVQAIRHDSEPKMPPENKLPDEAIAKLTQWVKMGAPWGAETETTKKPADAWKSHWAFQPVRRPELPAVKNAGWPQSDLDRFVLAKLEEHGLTPSAAADRRTLIRRANFDVTGLPPTYAEVEAFVNDPSPDAFEQVIERLLASPSFGERWARHWLDVARYADTKGYVFTQDRRYPNAYRYRDWVVRAINNDLPYDKFLIQQIAADRSNPGDTSALEAMGFLTVGRRFLNNPHDIIDDRLDVLTRGTMALTVTCARCHDHKYDPIPTKDYYSLYGVMASSVEPEQPADVMTLADAERPQVPYVFVRGNPGNRGDEVPRQFLSVLAGPERQPFGSGSGRLELAQAIASPDNPLTARVIVNRMWMYYFDRPLVRTPSDFGLRSEAPSHGELLDHLATLLMDQGWSLKAVHRAILRSASYQQASVDRPECRQMDPENQWLWRMHRKRLDFESLRDGLLSVSGQLDPTVGGPAVDLFKTPWIARRTLYGLIDRQNLPNLFRTFDFASPDTHSPQRFSTTVPQQALYMLNSPFVRDTALALAARVPAAENQARIEGLYRLVLSRAPREQELQVGLKYLGENTPRDSADASIMTAWQSYVQAVLVSNEFVFVD